jgi:hypothetical protein
VHIPSELFAVLTIGPTLAVFDPPSLDPDTPRVPIEELFNAYSIDVEVLLQGPSAAPTDAPPAFRLDAFEFFYEIIGRLYGLFRHEPWAVGSAEREGMIFSADPIRDGYRLSIGAHGVGCDEIELSMAGTTLVMAKILADIETSMRAEGIDLERYMDKYPPTIVW